MSRNIPNFFIAGGPKCGTTSLAEYLRGHPRVFFTDPKEPHYLATDLPRKQIVSNDDEYFALFDGVTADHLAAGEGSVWSLYSEVAVSKMLAINPQAKIIVMLRNPVEQVQSMHSYWVAIGMEDQLSFPKAWNLQATRSGGQKLPRASQVSRLYQYADIAKFGYQVERLLKTVPAEQVHIILLEDMKAAPAETFAGVLDFLQLPMPDEPVEFAVHNENKVARSALIAKLVRRVPTLLDPYVKAFKRFTGIKNLHLMHYINKLEKRVNQKSGKRKSIDEAMRTQLIETFRDDVQLLEKQIGRNLQHWLE